MVKTLSSSRREWITIAAITAVGAVLRARGFGSIALDHFDEGIYALAGLWSLGPRGLSGLDPSVIAYAPPAFPILVGAFYWFGGVSAPMAVAPSILSGIATIPVVGWIGLRSFGAGAGIAAAVFAALSMEHVDYSRMALTDASFLLAWLVAIGVGADSWNGRGLSRSIALGLAVGLAMNLKYNGWLAGILVLAAAVAGLASDPASRRTEVVRRTFGFGTLAALIALACYVPWFAFVQTNGGYGALAAHQRSYLGGPATWWPHLVQQLAQADMLNHGKFNLIRFLNPWFFTVFLRLAMVVFIRPGGLKTAPRVSAWDSTILLLLLTLGGDDGFWLALATTPCWLLDRRPAVRLLGVAWLIPAILTPFYHPYSRLWLPVIAVGWFALGEWARLTLMPEPPDDPLESKPVVRGVSWSRRLPSLMAIVLAAAWVFLGAAGRSIAERGSSIVKPGSTDLPPGELTARLIEAIDGAGFRRTRGSPPLILTLARPSYVLDLLQAGIPTSRVADLKSIAATQPAGRFALVDEGVLFGVPIGQIVEELGPRWKLIQTWSVEAEDVTWLDIDPAAARDGTRTRRFRLILFGPNTRP